MRAKSGNTHTHTQTTDGWTEKCCLWDSNTSKTSLLSAALHTDHNMLVVKLTITEVYLYHPVPFHQTYTYLPLSLLHSCHQTWDKKGEGGGGGWGGVGGAVTQDTMSQSHSHAAGNTFPLPPTFPYLPPLYFRLHRIWALSCPTKLKPYPQPWRLLLFVGCSTSPQFATCITGMDLFRQHNLLPHWHRSCRWNLLPHPVVVYWHWANLSKYQPYDTRTQGSKPGQPSGHQFSSHWHDLTGESRDRSSIVPNLWSWSFTATPQRCSQWRVASTLITDPSVKWTLHVKTAEPSLQLWGVASKGDSWFVC